MPSLLSKSRHLALAAAALALVAAGMWLALQGGLSPAKPPEMAQVRVPTQIVGVLAGIVIILTSALPVLATFWLSAAGFGRGLRKRLQPVAFNAHQNLVLDLGLGLAAMLSADWLLGWAGLLNTWTAWGLCTLGAMLIIWDLADEARQRQLWNLDTWPNPPWTLLLGLPLLGLWIVACACPPGTLWSTEAFGYDVLSYHLELPREWLMTGRLTGLHHNVYSYLPNLVEAGYMHLGAMHGSVYAAIYTCQFFHASTALLTALVIGCMVARSVGKPASWLAGIVFLSLPWTIITGTSAYDEMAALALAGVALMLTCDPRGRTIRGALLLGFVLGTCTLAKLTIGAMLVPPLLLLLLLRLADAHPTQDNPTPSLLAGADLHPRDNEGQRWRNQPSALPNPLAASPLSPPRCLHPLAAVALAGLALLLTLAPYFIRNTIWTGNPIFPMATRWLGHGYWDQTLTDRWNAGHSLTVGFAERLAALDTQWLRNVGYGAVGGTASPHTSAAEHRNIARFPHEHGLPVFWLTVALGAAFTLIWPPGRPFTLSLLLLLGWSLVLWLFATHLQSRFLIPTLLPGGILLGLAAGRVAQLTHPRLRWAFPIFAVALCTLLVSHNFLVFWDQTIAHTQPWQIADSLPRPQDLPRLQYGQALVGDHPINYLPPNSRTLLVADNSHLLYIRRPFVYNSAFDPNPLGQIIRQVGPDPATVTQTLKQMGITHVWVHWSELARLHETYGYDPDVTLERLQILATGWNLLHHFGVATLYALP